MNEKTSDNTLMIILISTLGILVVLAIIAAIYFILTKGDDKEDREDRDWFANVRKLDNPQDRNNMNLPEITNEYYNNDLIFRTTNEDIPLIKNVKTEVDLLFKTFEHCVIENKRYDCSELDLGLYEVHNEETKNIVNLFRKQLDDPYEPSPLLINYFKQEIIKTYSSTYTKGILNNLVYHCIIRKCRNGNVTLTFLAKFDSAPNCKKVIGNILLTSNNPDLNKASNKGIPSREIYEVSDINIDGHITDEEIVSNVNDNINFTENNVDEEIVSNVNNDEYLTQMSDIMNGDFKILWNHPKDYYTGNATKDLREYCRSICNTKRSHTNRKYIEYVYTMTPVEADNACNYIKNFLRAESSLHENIINKIKLYASEHIITNEHTLDMYVQIKDKEVFMDSLVYDEGQGVNWLDDEHISTELTANEMNIDDYNKIISILNKNIKSCIHLPQTGLMKGFLYNNKFEVIRKILLKYIDNI